MSRTPREIIEAAWEVGKQNAVSSLSEAQQEQVRVVVVNAENHKREYGCEVVVNGVLPTVRYYLRLFPDLTAFLREYNAALLQDYEANTDLKETHLRAWQIIAPREGFTASDSAD